MSRRVRAWSTIVVATAVLALSACGGSGGGGASSAATGAPVKIGLLGWFSGVGGPTHLPKKQTYEAWAATLNDKGGINGHPVQVIAVDDGGNQAQAATIARDLIDNKGVVALAVTGTVEGGGVAYAKEKNVPVIGVVSGPPDQQDNPMMFKTGPGYDQNASNLAAQVRSAGITKVAAFYCTEGASCKANVDQAQKALAGVGVQIVYQASISLSAPDYTAECIQARNSGAQAIYPVGTTSTPSLIADSCAGQDYRVPMLINAASTKQADDKALEGAVTVLSSFPWFLTTGNPAVEEYAAALKAHAPKLLGTDGTADVSAAWVAAKVFQRAAETAFPAGGTPSPAALLPAVQGLKDYTVDGLSPGCMAITFGQGATASSVKGSFSAKIQGGKWVATNGLNPVCTS